MKGFNNACLALALFFKAKSASAGPSPRDFGPADFMAEEKDTDLSWSPSKVLDLSKTVEIDEWKNIDKRLGKVYSGEGSGPMYVWVSNSTHAIQLNLAKTARMKAEDAFEMLITHHDMLSVIPLSQEDLITPAFEDEKDSCLKA